MIARMLLLIGLVLGTLAQALAATETLVTIYDGSAALPAKVTLGNWGFMPRPPTPKPDDNPFKPLKLGRNWYALKLSSLGRYQGARFDFQVPLETASFNGVPNTYLQLYLRSLDDKKAGVTEGGAGDAYTSAAITNPNPTDVPPPPPPPPDGTGVGPGVGGPGVGPAGPTIGPDGLPTDAPVEMRGPVVKPNVIPMPDFKNLRFTFITEKGPAILDINPAMLHPVDDGKWARVEIPMSLLNKQLPMGEKLQRLLITADEPLELFVGRILIVKDATPLSLTTFIYPNFLEAGQRIFFAARVATGLSQYEVRWDFDTKGGASVDAVGERVTHVFDTEGNYSITCTLVDKNGGKEPTSVVMDVKVSRALNN
jgi:hypothetical protein